MLLKSPVLDVFGKLFVVGSCKGSHCEERPGVAPSTSQLHLTHHRAQQSPSAKIVAITSSKGVSVTCSNNKGSGDQAEKKRGVWSKAEPGKGRGKLFSLSIEMFFLYFPIPDSAIKCLC